MRDIRDSQPVVPLMAEWACLMRECGFSTLHSAELDKLCLLYQEEHRHYHTLVHVQFCLAQLDKYLPRFTPSKVTVALAVWFHDAIYLVGSNDNEQKSAQLFSEFASRAGLDKALEEKVSCIIRATTHREEDLFDDPDCHLMLDIDLLPLARSKRGFDIDSRRIRREYAMVPDDEFFRKRKFALQSFLEKPIIYHSKYVRFHCEKRARANLQAAIKELEAKGF